MKTIKLILFPLLAIITLTLSACTLGSNPPAAIAPVANLTLTINAMNAGDSFITVGKTINYNYTVTNTGKAGLPGPIIITDTKMAVNCPALTSVGNLDTMLDPNETLNCTHAYNITQSDLNA